MADDAGTPTDANLPSRWVVYSTFHARGACTGYCEEQLQAYREAGWQTLVVDSSPVVTPEREACWRRVATDWFHRENVGYDFGSYQAGVARLVGPGGLDPDRLSLILANDSCFGPYTRLDALIAAFDAEPVGDRKVFGITESLYFFRHLQSYWIYFRPEVTRYAVAFFATLAPAADREAAVQHGELGLSAFLVERGCRLVVPYTSEELVERFRAPRFGALGSFLEFGLRKVLKRPRYTRNGDGACLRRFLGMPFQFNPTAAFGVEMHVRGMTPFVKRQLLRENPNGDRLVPAVTEDEVPTSEAAFRALRRTTLFRKRYGAAEAERPYVSGGSS